MTLPASPGNNQPAWNGSYFVYANSARNVFSSPDGVTWTTHTSAIPTGASGPGPMAWDGTYWVCADNAKQQYSYITSVADGSSGWTLMTNNQGWNIGGFSSNGAGKTACIYGMGNTNGWQAGSISAVTTNAMTSITTKNQPYTVGTPTTGSGSVTFNAAGIFWNGYIFIYGSGTGNFISSTDGINWLPLTINNMPIVGNPQPQAQYWGFQSDAYVAGGLNQFTVWKPADTSTGSWIHAYSTGIGAWTYLVVPTCTPSTQFCLPTTSSTSWIRVL